MITLNLPYPPSTNHQHGQQAGGGRFLKPVVKKYRKGVRDYLLEHIGLYNPIEGLLGVQIDLYPPDNIKRDIDNPIKPILDALQSAALVADDSQFKLLQVRMHPKGEQALAKVCITRLCDD